MDVFSHALWGGVAFGRASKRDFALATAIGALPDLIPFTIPFAHHVWNGIVTGAIISPPRPGSGYEGIPDYVFTLYSVTHSLVIFSVVFVILSLMVRRPLWILGAWGLHICMDIFTHARAFFPTPLLWPISDVTVDGTSWGTPMIFYPNLALLMIAYGVWWWRARRKSRETGS